MVQFFQTGPSRKSLMKTMLGQSIGEGLAGFTNNYLANKAMEGIINDKSLHNAPPEERAEALQRALEPYGETGLGILQRRMGIEQQREQRQQQQKDIAAKETYAQELGLPKEVARSLTPQEMQKHAAMKKQKQLGVNVRKALIDAGYPEPTANLWQQQVEGSTEGGLTDTIKQVNNLLSRSATGKGQTGEAPKNTLKPAIEIPGIENKAYELDFPELRESLSRNPSEVVKEEEGNKKHNVPLYAETVNSLNALDEDFRDIAQLQEYNEQPGALPTGLEKWNVDWDTGDLRFKALGSPEAQNYVKIIARLLGRAKEYFPGRVTNFDLAQFRTRFPTLANSPEGRRLIAEQLSLANRIAFLKDETMKSAIDHYGAGADPTQIQKYATQNYRRLKGDLEKDLKGLNARADAMVNQSENAPQAQPRQKVSPGTKISQDIVDNYLRMTDFNPEQAEKMALEDGYEL